MFITKEKYDALVAERDSAKQELETRKAEEKTSEEEFTRIESEKKAADDKAAALTTEKENLSKSIEQKDQEIATLKAENADLKKLPGAETARVKADKEQGNVSEEKTDLAVNDDMTIMEKIDAVDKKYLK